ncbi:MAG: CDP-glycerol glycerophosphotransferase family protein [Candidatus Nitrosotenuis sp.]
MNNLRILSVIPHPPNETSIDTVFFKNLLPILKQKINVEIIWFVYTQNKLSSERRQNSDIALDIHDYRNALDVLTETKPDLIMASPVPTFIDYAFTSTAKRLGIPTMGIFDTDTTRIKKRTKLFKSNLTAFFQNSAPSSTHKSNRLMGRGIFFLQRYIFLLNTQRKLKNNFFQIISDFLLFVKIMFFDTHYPLYPKFSCNLHFLDGERQMNSLIKKGFDKTTLVVTGNPMYDSIFKRIKNPTMKRKDRDKVNVLLMTTSVYEHGYWSKNQRDETIKQIVLSLSSQKEFHLTIKIHPSSEKLVEYQTILQDIGVNVDIYQQGDVLDFLEESDLVLAVGYTTALNYAVIGKKPIIFCNFYNQLQNEILIERGLAIECKDPTSLIPTLKKVSQNDTTTEQKRSEHIKDFFYSDDGLASERVSNLILQLAKKPT